MKFKYYISRGLGDERFVNSQPLFNQLRQAAEKVAKEIDLGGNASTMALRAFLEGCKIKVGFPLNREYYSKYFRNNTDRVELIDGIKDIRDYHLSINYYRKDIIWDHAITRSNRIFLNHDVDNDRMQPLKSFIRNMDDMDIVVIGGTQLPNNYTNFVNKLVELKNELSKKSNEHRLVHLESSAFSNSTFYTTQLDILLGRINSFGMNEREFIEFINFMEDRVRHKSHH